MHATLEEFLDRQRAGLAGTYLTRLKMGAAAGRRRGRAARSTPAGSARGTCSWSCWPAWSRWPRRSATTPVGQEWAVDLQARLADVVDRAQGWFA